MRVVIDTFNSALPQGTGIATYARSLAHSLHRQGHSVDLMTAAPVPRDLFWSSRKMAPSSVLVWDHPKSSRPEAMARGRSDAPFWISNSLYSIRTATDRFFPGLAGTSVLQLDAGQLGLVDRRPLTDQYGYFDGVFNVPNIYQRALTYFAHTGRFLSVTPKNKIDVAHFSWCLPIHVKGAHNVYTVCDLIPLRYPSMTLDDKSIFYRLVEHCVRFGDQVVTISESSKRDILELVKSPDAAMSNVYLPFDIEPGRLTTSLDSIAPRLKQTFGLEPRSYFIIAGTIEPRKNISRAIAAFLSADTDCAMVICGPRNSLSDEELILLRGVAGIRKDRIVMLDYLPRPLLLDLIQGARATVAVSLAEGFGLPALESMALGTPVIASNIDAHAEVCGDAAILVDPYDTHAIGAAMERVSRWSNSEIRAAGEAGRRRAAEFSPENFDRRIAEVYAAM